MNQQVTRHHVSYMLDRRGYRISAANCHRCGKKLRRKDPKHRTTKRVYCLDCWTLVTF